MKTQVTKRKLTLKSKKAATDTDAAGGGGDASEAAPAMYAAPEKTVVDTAYHKPAAIMAIIAAVIFLGLVAVQAMEWLYYQSPPSVWPLKIPGAAPR